MYFPGTNTVLMRDTFSQVNYASIRSWQRDWNMDFSSFQRDPLFADAAIGDFHLQSTGGRFDTFSQSFVVTDTDTSWGIDSGPQNASVGDETEPNGNRINIGRYAGSGQASRSSSDPALLVVSLRDGGTASVPQPLIWLSRGVSTSETVTVEYSGDGGITWTVLTTNIPVATGRYDWNNELSPSTPLSYWRVSLNSNPGVRDTNTVRFTQRIGPIVYYVNDANLLGDIYAQAVGGSMNNGITVTTPLHTVSAVLDEYDLDGGDVVYVDTGTYPLTDNIKVLSDDAGVGTNYVRLVGSTNFFFGGTVLQRINTNTWDTFNSNHVFEIISAAFVEISDFTIENGNFGVFFNNPFSRNESNILRRLFIRDGGLAGVRMNNSSGNRMEQVIITRMAGPGIALNQSQRLFLDGSVVWSNRGSALTLALSSAFVSNSVLHAYGAVTNVAVAISESTVVSDYNNYWVEGDASYGMIDGEPISGIPQWSFRTTQDYHTISVDPLFNNATSNDFHPRSIAGRFDPVFGFHLTNDVEHSWLIDTANPLMSFTQEGEPNGGRRNIGAYGNTAQASKSRTNAWLLAVTAMAGGRAGEIFPLHWFYGNLSPTNRVDLDYSVNGGTNWTTIATAISITQDGYLWNSLNADPFRSPTTKWRVTLSGNTNVMDETDRIFGLNGPFLFYINDDSLVDDEFTTAIGDDNNLGISSNAPKATLRATLDYWDIDPEDQILVDTGTYLMNSNNFATVRISSQGSETFPVTIRGSTNGAVFDASAITFGPIGPPVIFVEAPYIVLRDLVFKKAGILVSGNHNTISNVTMYTGIFDILGNNTVLDSFAVSNGLVLISGTSNAVVRGEIEDGKLSLIGSKAELRNSLIYSDFSPLVEIGGTNTLIENNTLVANGGTAILQTDLLGNDSLTTLRNNIIIANGASGTAFCIQRLSGVIIADYNAYQVRNGAWFGNTTEGWWERLIYWQEKSGQDLNSIAVDPLFVNEAGGDFHLKSLAGRWNGTSFVADAVHSPAIDAGSPLSDFSQESAPNGNRVNIGAYGNTAQASRSLTEPWLFVRNMNDGGVLRGTNELRWSFFGMEATNLVTLQYSPNAGTNWLTIVAGVNVNDGSYVWNTVTASNTFDALWRVVLEGDTNVFDESDALFNIRNDVRDFFVNNASTNGDVFTTSVGSPLNDGRTPATPKASLLDILSTYDTEPNDTIYVDTGVYTSSFTQIIWSRSGASNANLIIRGSTNFVAGGTVLRSPSPSGVMMKVNASHVQIQDLVMENAGTAVLMETNAFTFLEGVEIRSNLVGVSIVGGENHSIRSSRFWNNSSGGINNRGKANVRLENLTFVDNVPYSILQGETSAVNNVIQNNIFYHNAPFTSQQFAITGPQVAVVNSFIDYNVYYFGASASNASIFSTFTNLLGWQRLQFKDFRSSITNPLFHDITSGDFHLRSEAGRYDTSSRVFVVDAETSWAIDKGNPYSVFTNEPDLNGGRVNVGAYGNTIYASKGTTNPTVFVRTANDLLVATADVSSNAYPLVWYMLNVPFDLTVKVEYSGDGGNSWLTLQSGVPAYQEYILWTNSPTYNSFDARWRIVGEGPGNTNYWDINDGQIKSFFGVHRISSIRTVSGGVNEIVWRGAWNEEYQVQYATNFVATNRIHNWQDIGAVTNLTIGGDTTYRDMDSTNTKYRVYRVQWLGTNGIPFQ
jgi:hypothetical protein